MTIKKKVPKKIRRQVLQIPVVLIGDFVAYVTLSGSIGQEDYWSQDL